MCKIKKKNILHISFILFLIKKFFSFGRNRNHVHYLALFIIFWPIPVDYSSSLHICSNLNINIRKSNKILFKLLLICCSALFCFVGSYSIHSTRITSTISCLAICFSIFLLYFFIWYQNNTNIYSYFWIFQLVNTRTNM